MRIEIFVSDFCKMSSFLSPPDVSAFAQMALSQEAPTVSGGKMVAEFLQNLAPLPMTFSPAEIPWLLVFVIGGSILCAIVILFLIFQGKSRGRRRRTSRFH